MAVGSGKTMLRVVTPDEVNQQEQEADQARIEQQQQEEHVIDNLAAFVRREWQNFRNWRSSEAINARLLNAMRVFEGEYSAEKLAEIRKFGGSQVYARIIGVKCRGATSLLRDVYLGPNDSWGLEPTPEPEMPEDVVGQILQLVQTEVQTLQQAGQPITDDMIQDRINKLMAAAKEAAKKQAHKQAGDATTALDDILVEGGFYKALAEFLVDLPLFPFAVMKGPVVRIVPDVRWENGQAVQVDTAKMFWERVSPFDIYWSPGANRLEDATIFEKLRLTQSDLDELIGLPGFDEGAIRRALQDYSEGIREWWDETDSERADLESREDPYRNTSRFMDAIEYHGPIQGKYLQDFGMEGIDDPDRIYSVQLWMVGRHVIKIQLSPTPRKRHPYYITSFEKVPGTIMGNGLPDILADIEEVANAALRALVNNMSISSGPQVVVNEDRLSPTENGDELYPWKRWHVMDDPLGSSSQPVNFFQPQSNAAELLGIYEKFSMLADEISAIPRYITGSERLGGAGRTASGLAMLMGNASKILQTVAANVDRDVLTPILEMLYDMVMLTSDTLRGDENIRVRGVAVAVQKETERMRQLELLNLTANPIDMEIMGLQGRANLLRSVVDTVGIEDTKVVPDEEEIAAKQMAMQQQQMAAQAAQAQGDQTALNQAGAPVDNTTRIRPVSSMTPGGAGGG